MKLARISTDVHVNGVPLYVCSSCGRAAVARVTGARMGAGLAIGDLDCEGWMDPVGWLIFSCPPADDGQPRDLIACPDCKPSIVAKFTRFLADLPLVER